MLEAWRTDAVEPAWIIDARIFDIANDRRALVDVFAASVRSSFVSSSTLAAVLVLVEVVHALLS